EAASRALSAAELKAKIAKLPVRMASRQVTVAKDEDIPRHESFEGYQFPGLDLLEEPESNYSAKMEDYVRQQAEVLETSLQTYGIDGEVAGIESGPVVTLYSVQLAPGTKVAKVQAIASDVARSLRAQNIRIVPNMVGKTTVGIEVPNLHKEKVRLKELMSGGHSSGMHLPMFLGKDAAGEPLVADLTRMPHMLIAGTTGSGKSVCMNTIIMSWLYTKRPDELKLVLVDPKMVEMSQFSDVPHLMCPVVTEMSRAAAILEWAVTKMEERYELLKEAMVRDIASYNDLGEEELCERLQPSNELERAKIPKKLPYMVFIIDELADLIMTHKEVESSIVRIAQKARAVGIHLILATQRPQANVVTGLIKSNMPCRVSFRVASGMDSRIVLDQKGAELLLGQGDMMVLQPHSSEIMRAQGTLVTDLETRRVAKFLKSVAGPSFERTLLAIRPGGAGDADDRELDEDGLPLHERDPLFDKAVEIMIESGRGSVSLLQRRLAIGYTRASRLVDQMGRAGILSDHKGTVARDVVISMEDWERMKALEAAEAEGRGDDDTDEHQALDDADVDALEDEDDDVEIETIDLDDDTPVGRRHADA
ncbi:MAG: DNA translocase FtsK, partial [Phycisphaerales bacterium]|nr:DNA translocase FtsK [Phycisphaerales bacterium]